MIGREESGAALRLLKKIRVRGQAKPSMWFVLVSGSSAETAGNEDDDLEVHGDFGTVLEIVGTGEEGEDNNRATTGGEKGCALRFRILHRRYLGWDDNAGGRGHGRYHSKLTIFVF